MKYYTSLAAIVVITIMAFSASIYKEKIRILSVISLPEDDRFYSHTAGSHYDLSYVFRQKTLFGFVFSSSYKTGNFALSYANSNLTPYTLSNTEFVQLLAMYDLPTPTRLPAYPWHENPLWFYIISLCILFLAGKTAIRPLTKNVRRWKGQMNVRKMSAPYAGYLRRRY
ncbi:MAG: hypothetical protein ACRCVN_03245 [Spirochaetia bacterium]